MKRFAFVILAVMFATGVPAAQDLERLFKSAINTEKVDRNYKVAIEQYRKVAAGPNRTLAAQALLRMAECYRLLGDAEAQRIYERIVKEFKDLPDVVAEARKRFQPTGASVARAQEPTRRIVPIWTGGGVGYGRPSRDGRYIAFQAGTGDLAIRDVVANETRRLTNTGGWVASGDFAQDPVVSPDNRFVAYTWYIEADERNEIRVLPIQDGGAPRTLMRTVEPEAVDWTPDGTRLVMLSGRGPTELGLLTVSDGRYQMLKSFERNPGRVSLSQDGRYVAYTTQTANSKRDIVVRALDGSSETPALAGPEDDFNPFWAPGGYLVFMREDTAGVALWTVRMQGGRTDGRPILVRRDLGRINPLGITRDGSLYYALSGAQRHDIYIAQLDNSVATSSRLVASQAFDGRSGPAWTPDGELLTYWAVKPQPGITLRSIKSGQERTIALPPGTATNLASPKWFPDGRSLLLPIRSDDGMTLSRFNIDNGSIDRLVNGSAQATTLAVAPDGSAIYWAGSEARLMRLDLKTREEQELKRDVWFLAIAISPDGKEIAYLRNSRQAADRSRNEAPGYLEVIGTRGGEPRQVFRDPIWYGPSRFNTLAWTPDQKNLLAVRDDGVLWRIPLDGGAPQSTGISALTYEFEKGQSAPRPPGDRRVKSPAVHADGRTLAFALGEVLDREIWSLENFLPVAAK